MAQFVILLCIDCSHSVDLILERSNLLVPVPDMSAHVVMLVTQTSDGGQVVVGSHSCGVFESSSVSVNYDRLSLEGGGSIGQSVVVGVSQSKSSVLVLEISDDVILGVG